MNICESTLEAALGSALVRVIGEKRYQLWFDGKTRLRRDGDRLIVGVANRFIQEWLQTRYQKQISQAVQSIVGSPPIVDFVIDGELYRAAREAEAAVAAAPTLGDAQPGAVSLVEVEAPAALQKTGQDQLPGQRRRWKRFHDFVEGPSNRVALAAARQVVEQPEEAPRPLVFHGPTGTGKTHLLESIARELYRSKPSWRIQFVTAEDFTNRFLSGMRDGKLGGFRKVFREANILFVDDLQFLARKRATQEEFLHTLDALVRRGHMLVASCDCHPRLSDDFLPELADRLLGGAVWGIQSPESATRFEILRSRALGKDPLIPELVLRLLADSLRGNVRELEGALLTLQHFCRASNRPADMEAAHEALSELLHPRPREVDLKDIDEAVCAVLQLARGALQSSDRSWATTHARMLAMYLARKLSATSYSEIGKHFGGRNHSTVVAAEKKVRTWLRADFMILSGAIKRPAAELLARIEHRLSR